MPSSDSHRLQLIERLLKLPSDKLLSLEDALRRLESPVAHKTIPAVPVLQRDWPHAPVHRISEHGTYMVTAGTYQKQHLFRGAERLDLLEASLLTMAHEAGWHLEAWAVFSNHYHFIGHSRPDSQKLSEFTKRLHAATAVELNRPRRRAGSPGLAQLLGHATHVRKVVPCPAELRPSESGEARPRPRGEPVSLVLRGVV